jgi:hypothetical protein
VQPIDHGGIGEDRGDLLVQARDDIGRQRARAGEPSQELVS